MKKHHPTHISSTIKAITKTSFDKHGFHMLKLIEDWNLIIPEKWHKTVYPFKIVWNNNNQGILYVSTTNHIIKQLVLHESKILLEKANQYFGYNCLIKIKIM